MINLDDLAFVRPQKEDENHVGIERRVRQSYDDLDTAYQVGIEDLAAGVPLATVVKQLRREYAQVFRNTYGIPIG